MLIIFENEIVKQHENEMKLDDENEMASNDQEYLLGIWVLFAMGNDWARIELSSIWADYIY